MASYSSRVRADIARWLQAGLIDAPDGRRAEARRLGAGAALAAVALRFRPAN